MSTDLGSFSDKNADVVVRLITKFGYCVHQVPSL